MKEKLNKFGLSYFKVILTSSLCLFCLGSLVYVALTSNELFSYFYCIATFFFVALPLALSIVFKWKMSNLFYIIFTIYAFGPILGAVYNFYYHISWWDIFLHVTAGAVFAAVGTKLAENLNKGNNTNFVFGAIFGVLFSISIAVVWEFFEFGSDCLLNSDMQADTVITDIFTKINRTDGLTDVFENITITTVNGESLNIEGYLDIGLIDTMWDMITETIGAVVVFLFIVLTKNKFPLIKSTSKQSQ